MVSKLTNDDLRQKVQSIILNGMQNGESAYWIADDIIEFFTSELPARKNESADLVQIPQPPRHSNED
jgi:hypothetical protein